MLFLHSNPTGATLAVLEDRILSGAKALLLTTNFVQIATNDFKENMLPKAPVIGLFDEETEAERYVLNKKNDMSAHFLFLHRHSHIYIPV